MRILSMHYSAPVEQILLSRYVSMFRYVITFCVFAARMSFRALRILIRGFPKKKKDTPKDPPPTIDPLIRTKSEGRGFRVSIRIGTTDVATARVIAGILARRMDVFSVSGANSLILDPVREDTEGLICHRLLSSSILLTSHELVGLTHVPTKHTPIDGVDWIPAPRAPHALTGLPLLRTHPEITPIGTVPIYGRREVFGILPQDRSRHIYIVGKTGMGKSTLVENMLYEDIVQGRGVALIDPHGDLADGILAHIPKNRTNDVIIFDPSDQAFPIAFNMLEDVKPELRPVVASGIIAVFKKIFGEVSW